MLTIFLNKAVGFVTDRVLRSAASVALLIPLRFIFGTVSTASRAVSGLLLVAFRVEVTRGDDFVALLNLCQLGFATVHVSCKILSRNFRRGLFPPFNTKVRHSYAIEYHIQYSTIDSCLHNIIIQSSKHHSRNSRHTLPPPSRSCCPIKSLPHPQMTHHIQHPRRIRRRSQLTCQYAEFLLAQFVPQLIRVGECVP